MRSQLIVSPECFHAVVNSANESLESRVNREKVVDHFVGISAMDSALRTHGLAAINLELFSDMVSEISLIYELEATERARLIQFRGPMVDVA